MGHWELKRANHEPHSSQNGDTWNKCKQLIEEDQYWKLYHRETAISIKHS